MFETDKTLQPQLFAFTHRDLVESGSDVWLFIDLFDALDMSCFNKRYRGQGQLAKEPRLILRTIFYGLTHGVVTGRKLESVCRNDNRFIVLSGELRPDRRTFDRFIRRHEDLMKVLFIEIVRMAQKMDLVSLGRVAIDGSRFKGHTSSQSIKYEKIQKAIFHIEENLKRLKRDLQEENSKESDCRDLLPKEIRSQELRLEKIRKAQAEIESEHKVKKNKRSDVPCGSKRKSLNDSEALSLSHKSKQAMFGYNVQAAVDEKSQIIVAADLHNNATDYEALPKLLTEVKENCKGSPSSFLADLGYKSVENIRAIESEESVAYVAAGSEYKELEVEFFEQITKDSDQYKCLRGQVLPINSRRKSGRVDFNLPKNFCAGCEFSSTCKAYGKKTISVMSDADRKVMTSYYERARTEEFKSVYSRRKAIVEPVFGNIKNKGMRIFVLGRKKVQAWWFMACTAHNIEKIVKAQAKKREFLKNKLSQSLFFEINPCRKILNIA